MKFKAGDRVKVREDLEGNTSYNGLYFNPKMEVYKGKTIIIERINYTGHGLYVASGWHWNDEMLEPVKEEKKMRNIDKILSDETLLNEAICSACYIIKNGHDCDDCDDCNVVCNKCEFSTNKNCYKFLAEEYKPKIKLTKLEHDLLKIDVVRSSPFGNYADYMNLKNIGHFKGITDLSMTIQDILDNCEIEEGK